MAIAKASRKHVRKPVTARIMPAIASTVERLGKADNLTRSEAIEIYALDGAIRRARETKRKDELKVLEEAYEAIKAEDAERNARILARTVLK